MFDGDQLLHEMLSERPAEIRSLRPASACEPLTGSHGTAHREHPLHLQGTQIVTSTSTASIDLLVPSTEVGPYASDEIVRWVKIAGTAEHPMPRRLILRVRV